MKLLKIFLNLSLMFAITLVIIMSVPKAGEAKIIFEKDSLYHHIVVREDDSGKRFLSFNRVRGDQSAVLPGHPEVLTYTYTKSAMAALCFLQEEPKEMLFIGTGAGTVPGYIRLLYPKVKMDLVEIDPMVIEVAAEFFDFKPDKLMQVSAVDGRIFLRKNNKKYDFIFLDAYNDSSVPFHLTTEEFLQLAKKHLAEGGVLASNVWSESLNRYFNAQIKTYQEVFEELHLFKSPKSGNYIFVVTNPPYVPNKSQLLRKAAELKIPPGSLDLEDIIKKEYEYATGREVNERPLTDDFAPVNVMRFQE